MRTFPVDLPADTLPSYGVDANRIGTLRVKLDKRNSLQEIRCGAFSFIWCYDASSLAAKATININSQKNDGITFGKGMMLKGFRADKFYVTNQEQVDGYLDFIYLRGDNANFDVQNVSQGIDYLSLTVPSAFNTGKITSTGDGFKGVITPNVNVEKIILQNHYFNSETWCVASSNAKLDNDECVFVHPGNTLEMKTKTPIHVAANTANESLNYVEFVL